MSKYAMPRFRSYTAALFILLSGGALSAGRMLEHAFPERVSWYFNPEHCQETVLAETRDAFDLWEHLLQIEIDYKGLVGTTPSDGSLNVVRCMLPDDFAEIAVGHALTTLNTAEDLSISFEIVFQSTITGCELHEVSHALGLAHDPVADPLNSIMAGCNFAEYPTTEELQVMATIYGKPVNCTPVMLSDNSLFIPALNGYWYRAVYSDSGWVFSEQGANSADLACNIVERDGRLQGEYFDLTLRTYKDMDLYRDGNAWKSSPTP